MTQNIVNLLGAGSGIDTQALVTQLVELQRAPTETRIENQRTELEAQLSDFGLINSALSTLDDAANQLSDPDTFNTKNASFSDSTILTATNLDADALTGEYSFEVTALAKAQSLSTEAVFDDPTDEIGTGTLTFNFGQWDVALPPADPTTFSADSERPPQSITINQTNNSLNGLADAINDADMGVQARVVNDGSGYRLLMTADSGLNNQISIDVVEDGLSATNTDDTGLSRLAFNNSAFQMTQNQAGQDAGLIVNGLSVTRTTNAIDDVIEGFDFTLNEASPGEVINVTITEDKSVGETAIRDFVAAYNTFLEVLEPLIGNNTETDEFGSLKNDSIANSIPTRIHQLLVDRVPGLAGDYTSLTNIGIRTERDGTLYIDSDDPERSDDFNQAIENNYDLLKELFYAKTESSNDNVIINGFNSFAQTGEYEVVITQDPSQAELAGSAIGGTLLADLNAGLPSSALLTGTEPTATLADFLPVAGNLTGTTSSIPLGLASAGAAADAYDFTITVDGIDSAANISLPIADYASQNDIATALQSAINNDANISGVSVTYDTDHFVVTSGSTGTSSSVAISNVGSSASQLGFTNATSNAGSGGANDFDFALSVDGVTSGTISITPGTYASFNDVASELQTQINADTTLSAGGQSVSVVHNGSEFLVTSNATGVSSTLSNFTPIGVGATSLGLSNGTLEQGSANGSIAHDYDFTLSFGDTTSGTISITPGAYADEDALARELQTQINNDPTLLASGKDVDVSYDTDTGGFVITDRDYGSKTNFTITNIGTSAADLGLSTGTFTAGKDVEGTVNGEEGFGVGNVFLPKINTAPNGINFIIKEGAAATTATSAATINFSRGIGGELERMINQFIATDGVIDQRESNINDDVESLDDDQSDLDRRVEIYQERITAQFIAMEQIVRSLNSSRSFLQTTLSNLLDSGNDN